MIFQCHGAKYTHEFYVVKKLAFEVVLGIDFLTKYHMQMKCGEEIEVRFDKSCDKTLAISAFTRDDTDVKLQRILEKNKDVFDTNTG